MLAPSWRFRAYNAESEPEVCLTSNLAFSFSDLEVFAVDDGFAERTNQIARSFAPAPVLVGARMAESHLGMRRIEEPDGLSA